MNYSYNGDGNQMGITPEAQGGSTVEVGHDFNEIGFGRV